MTTEAAIEISELRKRYRNGFFGKPVDALRGVSFQVRRGEVFGLLGPNGAGKTTVLKILLGIARKTSGSAALLGMAAGAAAGRRRVGYLPENLQIPRHHTAGSAMRYYGRLSKLSSKEIAGRADKLLDDVGLADWRKVSVRKFSKGMLQRLGLAQSLLHDPDLLILDEPTDGLDPVGRSQVRAILNDLRKQGKTVFLNSHLLQEVELVCDRVAILSHGTLRFVGPIDEITPRRETEVELELFGPEAAIRASLDGQAPEHFKALGADRFRIVVRMAEQADVDRCLDSLRRNNVSIIGLSRRRVTLEDAFLELVGKAGTKS